MGGLSVRAALPTSVTTTVFLGVLFFGCFGVGVGVDVCVAVGVGVIVADVVGLSPRPDGSFPGNFVV